MQTAAHRRESSEEISAELAQFDHLYRVAESGPGAHAAHESDVPDGEYLAVVEQVDLTRSRTSGNNMLVWRLRISDGVYAGSVVRKHRVITERTIPWLKEELVKCGLNLERLSELPKYIPQLPGKELRVLKRTRDGNSNVYIQWAGPRPVESDEDLPF